MSDRPEDDSSSVPSPTTSAAYMQRGIEARQAAKAERRARLTELLAAVALVFGGGGALYAIFVGVRRGHRLETLERQHATLERDYAALASRPGTPASPPAPSPVAIATPAPRPSPPPPQATPAAPTESPPVGESEAGLSETVRRLDQELQTLLQALDAARAERDYFLAEAARRDLRLRELEAAVAQLGQPVPAPPPEAPRPRTYDDMVRRAGLSREPITDGATQPAGAFEDGAYPGPAEGHTIGERAGGFVTLEDGSRWEVHRTSRSEILVWQAGDAITIQLNPVGPDGFGYLLQNQTRRSQASVRLSAR